jgi:hypothetical protein
MIPEAGSLEMFKRCLLLRCVMGTCCICGETTLIDFKDESSVCCPTCDGLGVVAVLNVILKRATGQRRY